jgi:hypothetical protein
MRSFYLLLTIFGFFLLACEKNKEKPKDQMIQIDIQPVFGNVNLYLDSVYYTQEGYAVKFTDIKLFLSDLKNESDSLNFIAYFDLREKGTLLLKQKGDHTKFAKLSGTIGVIPPYNNADPSLFPNENPLNISNAGTMHWSWNTGYIFYAIEGRVDTLIDNTLNFNQNFSFHIGMNSNLRPFEFENLNWQKINDHTHQLKLKLDLAHFLNNPNRIIDLKTEYLTHTASGQEQVTTKVVESFKESLKVQ